MYLLMARIRSAGRNCSNVGDAVQLLLSGIARMKQPSSVLCVNAAIPPHPFHLDVRKRQMPAVAWIRAIWRISTEPQNPDFKVFFSFVSILAVQSVPVLSAHL